MKLIVNWFIVLNNDLWNGNKGIRNTFLWFKLILNILRFYGLEINF